MQAEPGSILPTAETVVRLLQDLHGARLNREQLQQLARDIQPYLDRTALSLEEAVQRISTNYLRDGARVKVLGGSAMNPGWQNVLAQVVAYAGQHTLFPSEADLSSSPDLEAYDDIQRKLHTYNFEAPLDNWITVTVVWRLRRFWRDRAAVRAGGAGFKDKATREAERATGTWTRPPIACQQSLEATDADGQALMDTLADDQLSLAQAVEDAEIERAVVEAVDAYAELKHDPVLAHIWWLVVDRRLKLREVGELLDLTIAQVHRRVRQIRAYLRSDEQVRRWFDRLDEAQGAS